MDELCPDALLLQYVNPMAMLCWAVAETSRVRTVGLCHSVQHTAGQLAAALEIDPRELDYVVAGINHLAFFLSLERDDEDLYPRLRELVETDRVPAQDRVRFEVLRRLGYFVTESSEHFAEYVPWFIKSGAARADRAVRDPARRVPAALRAPDRGVGRAARRACGTELDDRDRTRATSTAPTSSMPARPVSRSGSTATSRTRAPAGG